jgi:hypothetical protein
VEGPQNLNKKYNPNVYESVYLYCKGGDADENEKQAGFCIKSAKRGNFIDF